MCPHPPGGPGDYKYNCNYILSISSMNPPTVNVNGCKHMICGQDSEV